MFGFYTKVSNAELTVILHLMVCGYIELPAMHFLLTLETLHHLDTQPTCVALYLHTELKVSFYEFVTMTVSLYIHYAWRLR